ncbi:lysine--tRNA ligase [Candidatus Uhrbacteria bacterium]|nr:lysine--tRNA ligase [Candidatus Uhrbacteria bacterium]
MEHSDERDIRIQKAETLAKHGVDPYPNIAERTHTCSAAESLFDDLSSSGTSVTLVGRVRSIRRHGGSTFCVIQDAHARFQVFLRRDTLGDEQYMQMKDFLDMGDFLQAKGTLFLTKTEEKTLHATSVRILTKAFLPLPEQWHGLSDMEMRYRRRYLDLIVNESVRDIFEKRACIVRAFREFLEKDGFMEVETPILQSIPGGALARPFVTHHHALDEDMYLRIAPELFLKRLIIGGFERVYEFARCFRNEGIDHSHNPEFTQVEGYMAYADYTALMDMVERMLFTVVEQVHKESFFEYRNTRIDMTPPYQRKTFRDSVFEATGIDIETHTPAELKYRVRAQGIGADETDTTAHILDLLFKNSIKTITQPTFIIDAPLELLPLAKKKKNTQTVESVQLIIAGMEILKGFSELNDPIDQAQRFEDQQKQREQGDEEAHWIDSEYVTALEYGLPPTAGFGIGIDRFTALLTNSGSLKEVMLFPTLRSKDIK